MSKYTTELRFVCEMAANRTEQGGYDDIDEIIELAAPKIFNNYPIFDENYRPVLEKKILMHYYTREISEEVVGLWKLRLASRMNEIMPYFNKLYDSELLKFNPLYDVDYTIQRENSGTRIGTNKGTVEAEGSKSNSAQSNSITDVTKDSTIDNETITTGNETEAGKNIKEVNQSQSGTSVGSEFTKNVGDELSSNNRTNERTIEADTSTAGGETSDTKDTTATTQGGSETTTSTGSDVTTGKTDTTVDVEGENHRTDTETHWDMYSDTPQSTIRDIGTGQTDHNYYLTNARENTDNIQEDTEYSSNTETHTANTGSTVRNSGTSTIKDGTVETSGSVKTSSATNSNTLSKEAQKDNEISTGNITTNSEKDSTITKEDNKTSNATEEASNNVSKVTNESSINSEKMNGSEAQNVNTSSTSNGFTNDTTKSDYLNTLNTTDEYAERVFGKRGSVTYAKMLTELRDSFINIDLMIIRELGDLFFGLW